MVDIIVVTGFLGSGKTTFIQNYVKSYEGNDPVVIIENDYGSTGVDALALASTKTIISELNNGCVCCSLGNDLIDSIERIVREYHPIRIIIEPSGIAMLSDLLLKLNHPRITLLTQISTVICVVDGYRYAMYLENFDYFYEDQIRGADVLVLTHMDLRKNNKVNELENNYDIRIYDSSKLRIEDYQDLVEKGQHITKFLVKKKQSMKLKTMELNLSDKLTLEGFNKFTEWMLSHYNIVRIKGNIIINNEIINVQYNWSHLTLEKTHSKVTCLTIIGYGLDRTLQESVLMI